VLVALCFIAVVGRSAQASAPASLGLITRLLVALGEATGFRADDRDCRLRRRESGSDSPIWRGLLGPEVAGGT
jgi:hypothetical protein